MTLAEYEAREYERWLSEVDAQHASPEPEESQTEKGSIRAPRSLVSVAAAYRAEAPAVDPRQLALNLTIPCSVCGGPMSGMADLAAGQHVADEGCP